MNNILIKLNNIIRHDIKNMNIVIKNAIMKNIVNSNGVVYFNTFFKTIGYSLYKL